MVLDRNGKASPQPSIDAPMKSKFTALVHHRILAALLFTGGVQAAPGYSVTDLGTLGGNYGQGSRVNDAGQVAGFAVSTDNATIRPAVGEAGAPLTEAPSLGGSYGVAADINGNGHVAGSSATQGDASVHAFLETGGSAIDLTGGQPGNSRGLGLNDLGEVTGSFEIPAAAAEHAFVYRNGTLQDLGTLGGNDSQGNAINAAGQVAGWSDLSGDTTFHAFLWQAGVFTDLPTLGGSYGEGLAISSNGIVAGYATLAGDRLQRAVIWQPGQPVQDLGTLGGLYSTAYGVNAAGLAVGTSTTAGELGRRAFLWNGTAMVDLNTLIPPGSGIILTEAHGISENGNITGSALVGRETHAVLLTSDHVAPVITCPADVTTAGGQPASIGQAIASDNLDPAPVITNDRPPSFPLGETRVTWSATDSSGNSVSCQQRVRLLALSIGNVSKTEGDSGTTAFSFTVTLNTAPTTTVTVDYATVDGSAVAGSDYLATSGSLSFAPGQTSQDLTVSVKGDTVVEAEENFSVALSAAVGAQIAAGQGIGGIINDDFPQLRISDVGKAEGNSGTSAANFTVSLSAPAPFPVSVNYASADGSATAGSDYTATAGSLVFAPGQTSRTVAVSVHGDTEPEANEVLTVNLSGAAGASIGDGQGIAWILNDEGPLLRILDVTQSEGNAGNTAYTFSVTLSPAATLPVSVRYSTGDLSATAPADYSYTSGILNFAAGQTSQTVTVNVKGDSVVEPNEAFRVYLSAASGATIYRSYAQGTMLNDDGPVLTVRDVGTAEGGSGGTVAMYFNLSLSAPAAVPVTVSYATADGSAVAGSDYQPLTGSLTFAPGQTSRSIIVLGIGDDLVEANESFALNLTAASGATILDGQGMGYLLNDEGPLLRINDVAKAEGNAGVNAYTFTVSLSPAAAVPVTVNWATANSSAIAGSDYTAAGGSLNFAPGQTSRTVTVNVSGDTVPEANETFLVNLSSAAGATIFDSQGIGTLLNDD